MHIFSLVNLHIDSSKNKVTARRALVRKRINNGVEASARKSQASFSDYSSLILVRALNET